MTNSETSIWLTLPQAAMSPLNNSGLPACIMPCATGIITCMKLFMFSVFVAMFGFRIDPASTRYEYSRTMASGSSP